MSSVDPRQPPSFDVISRLDTAPIFRCHQWIRNSPHLRCHQWIRDSPHLSMSSVDPRQPPSFDFISRSETAPIFRCHQWIRDSPHLSMSSVDPREPPVFRCHQWIRDSPRLSMSSVDPRKPPSLDVISRCRQRGSVNGEGEGNYDVMEGTFLRATPFPSSDVKILQHGSIVLGMHFLPFSFTIRSQRLVRAITLCIRASPVSVRCTGFHPTKNHLEGGN